jgi:hypothetical protein
LAAHGVQVRGVGVLEEDKYPEFKGERGNVHAAFEARSGESLESGSHRFEITVVGGWM